MNMVQTPQNRDYVLWYRMPCVEDDTKSTILYTYLGTKFTNKNKHLKYFLRIRNIAL